MYPLVPYASRFNAWKPIAPMSRRLRSTNLDAESLSAAFGLESFQRDEITRPRTTTPGFRRYETNLAATNVHTLRGCRAGHIYDPGLADLLSHAGADLLGVVFRPGDPQHVSSQGG